MKNAWWFDLFNNPDYLTIYQDMTGPERTRQELDFCERVLHWKNRDGILDAPCGAGRHSINLAQRGYQVVGLDISTYLLNQAQIQWQSLRSSQPAPHWTRGLLQSLPFRDHTFPYIISMFSSFGYGETETDNLAVLLEYYRVLRPGGKILIDLMNRNYLLPRLSRVYESMHSGLRVREERTIVENHRRMHNHITVIDRCGEKRSYLYSPWLFNGWELSWLAARAGLKTEALYGNFEGDRYQETSERAMLIAIKPE